MAGGALTALSASIVCIVQFICRRRAGRLEILAILILTLMTAAMIYYVPVRDQDAPLKAHTIIEFVSALAQILSWPATPGPCLFSSNQFSPFSSIRRSLPLVMSSVNALAAPSALVLVALGGWTALQIAAIAYGRAAVPMAPRYFDTYVFGTILNAACLLYLIGLARPLLNGRRGVAALVVWFGLILPGLSVAAVLYFNQAAANMVTAQLETKICVPISTRATSAPLRTSRCSRHPLSGCQTPRRHRLLSRHPRLAAAGARRSGKRRPARSNAAWPDTPGTLSKLSRTLRADGVSCSSLSAF